MYRYDAGRYTDQASEWRAVSSDEIGFARRVTRQARQGCVCTADGSERLSCEEMDFRIELGRVDEDANTSIGDFVVFKLAA